MNLLEKIFGAKKDERLDALRAVLAENEKDNGWRDDFYAKALAVQSAYSSALSAFEFAPTPENAAAVVKASRELPTAQAFRDLHVRCTHTVNARILERTRPALKAALHAMLERLEAAIGPAQAAHEAAAAEFGTPAGIAPAVQAINATISDAHKHLAKLGTLDIHQVAPIVDFCIPRK